MGVLIVFAARSGGGVDYDLGKRSRVEACATNECAVDVFEAAEAGGVVRLHRAAVEDAGAGGERG